MASTTKIMTALIALEYGNIDQKYAVPKDAVGVEGSSVYLVEGEMLTLGELVYALMLESANDAAEAIAIVIAGSTEAFADIMNRRANELELHDTHFTNPHGLDDPEHYTTAHELAIIASEAMKNETFRKIVSTRKRTIPLNDGEGARVLTNHNKMLASYDGAIGIKTGYTKKSGRCLVSAAEQDGVQLIAVTLNAPNDWQDHHTMLDMGFDCYESVTLCDDGEFRYLQHVISGDRDCCVLTNTEEVSVTLPRGYGEIESRIELFRFSYAPIIKGDVMGYLVYLLDGEEIARVQICATHSVDRIEDKKSIWEKIGDLFAK
jgi:D-alanyl-D-alanine carboxypeptidase/D-alanyl-D-alanine carboxypeptidase (penicillin-binding protein 5/6)